MRAFSLFAVGVVMVAWWVSSASTQPVGEISSILDSPGEPLQKLFLSRSEILLQDVFKAISAHYGFPIEIDDLAFEAKRIGPVRGRIVQVPSQKGLKLGTILGFCLDQLTIDATYRIGITKLTIVPGRSTGAEEDGRKSPLVKNLVLPVQFPQGKVVNLSEGISLLEEQCNLPILIAKQDFIRVKQNLDFTAPLSIVPGSKLAAGQVLRKIVETQHFSALIRNDHIRLLPRIEKNGPVSANDSGSIGPR